MAVVRTIHGGKEAENFLNARLAEELRKLGYSNAGFERIFKVRVEGKEIQSKPDVSFSNGGVHIISSKFGERKELEAYTTADQYKEDLTPALRREGEHLGKVFAVVFPAAKHERFLLHVLPSEGKPELSFAVKSITEIAQRIRNIVEGSIEESLQEPILDEAKRLLRLGAEDLASTLKGVDIGELETIFGGHEFFASLLQPKLDKTQRASILKTGIGYFFVNQILFYLLLSRASSKGRKKGTIHFPEIRKKDFASPELIQDKYFQLVRLKDYEPIFGFDVVKYFKGADAGPACESVIRGINGLAPKLLVPDLVGQVFQSLIPLEVRKPLGAYYTNPGSAALLAALSISSVNDTVLDPACGSGTLIVAAYRRKMAISNGNDERKLHALFLEEQLTGMDAMSFVAHLAAVNLALQQPLEDTDFVRIAATDSTARKPGEVIVSTEAKLSREFKQTDLRSIFEPLVTRHKRGAIQTKRGHKKSFKLDYVDVVMMNPPFTSWDNMGESYRNSLKLSFSNFRADYRRVLYKKLSQQGFFLLLADEFLKNGGRIAAVLPLTTFTGRAFIPLLKFLLEKYSIEYFVVGLGRSSFSEDTSLTECLFVAKKSSPARGNAMKVIGLKKTPSDLTPSVTNQIREAVNSDVSEDENIITYSTLQESLHPENIGLSGIVCGLSREYRLSRQNLIERLQKCRTPLLSLESLCDKRQARIKGWGLASDHLFYFGPRALFGYGDKDRAIKENDRLLFSREEGDHIFFRDSVTGSEFQFSKINVRPALRRFSFLRNPDLRHPIDFVFTDDHATLEKLMNTFYTIDEAKTFLRRVRNGYRKGSGKSWSRILDDSSSTLMYGRRFDLAAPGTTVLFARSTQPVFLACDGFMIDGFEDREEKLLTLWGNSTVFLILILSRITITRGSWIKMEKSAVDSIPFPDTTKLTEEDWDKVGILYEELSNTELPSLIDQLGECEIRSKIDDFVVELLGLTGDEKRPFAAQLRGGALSAILLLRDSMQNRTGMSSQKE